MNQEKRELQPELRQPDLGLSLADIHTTLRVLDTLGKLPNIPEYVMVDAIHELRENQTPYAQARDNKHQRKEESKRVSRASRRRFLKRGAIAVASITAVSGLGAGIFEVGKASYDTYSSDTSEIKFEKSHTLGTEFSTTSKANWRIRYLGAEEPFDFVEDPSKGNPTDLSDYGAIRIGKDKMEISIHDYTLLNNKAVPELIVNDGSGASDNQRPDSQKHLLISEGRTDVNTKAVVFNNAEDNSELYFQITRKDTNPVTFELQPMKKIPKSVTQ